MTLQKIEKQLFFGPLQEAGVVFGMVVILAGMLMIIPYGLFLKKKSAY